MSQKRFSEVFSGCLPRGAQDPVIKQMRLNRERGCLAVELAGDLPSPAWAEEASRRIRESLCLTEAAVLFPDTPKPKAAQPRAVSQKPEDTLFGKRTRAVRMDIDTLPADKAKVCAGGRVFAVGEKRERRMKLGNRWGEAVSFEFYITDGTGSVCVRCVFEAGKAPAEFEKTLKKLCAGKAHVLVWGETESVFAAEKEEWIIMAAGAQKIEAPVRADNAAQKRVELHLHTQMSEKDATTPVAEAIATAARWGHPAVAVTDHGVCHSFPEAMSAAKKYGVKVIYGCEGYLESGSKRPYHIILLAATQTGLHNLYRLVSLSHTKHFKSRPIIPRELLSQLREGLIIGSACERGEVFSAVRAGVPRDELFRIASFYDVLEIQPLCNNHFLIREGLAKDEEQLRDWNRAVVELGKALNLPVCATGDVHFLEPEDEVYRNILLSNMNMLSNHPLPLYFKTTEEMLEEFSYLGEKTAYEVVVAAPCAVAERCGDVRPVRSGEFFPRLEGSAEELRATAYQKAREMYGEALPPMIEQRLEKELSSIIGKGYDIIYTISQKLVKRSMENGYLVGSRGSVGSSIAAYFAGITEVNALPAHYRCPSCLRSEFPGLDDPDGGEEKNSGSSCGIDLPQKDCPVCGTAMERDGFDIPFATFLGFDADKKPDIDLNFSSEYHERAGAHVTELFGEEKVFRAGTITTIGEKNAIGYTLKYIEKQGLNVPNAEMMRLAKGCEGAKITTGQHPGGMIIVPQDCEIYDFCPVHFAANKRDGKICTHFDYHAIEENLLKLDILGHDGPTFIRRLEELTGENALANRLDDPMTMSLFSSSKALGYEKDDLLGETGTVGIPEYGTRFVRGMLQKTKPSTFDELVRIAGLSHGTDVWRGNAESLIDAGTATLSDVICARDDITLFLLAKGLPGKLSLSISESVRKGKGLTPEWEEAMRGARVPSWYIDACKKIKYLFPKAHAVAYAMMSARIAWFKMHRPEAFYAVYFTLKINDFAYDICRGDAQSLKLAVRRAEQDKNSTKSDQDKAVVLEVCYEMLRRGISFEPLDIHKADPLRFAPSGSGRIAVPLMAVSGLGEAAAQSIAAAREKGLFLAEDDIAARCRAVTKAHIEALRAAGALGAMPETAQVSLFG